MQLMDTTTRTSRSVIGRTAATLGAAVMLSASAWSGASLTASADTETDAADTDATTTAAAAEDSSSADGRNSDVILNMFQWSWTSIAEECTSTIGPAGFGYVQVSPAPPGGDPGHRVVDLLPARQLQDRRQDGQPRGVRGHGPGLRRGGRRRHRGRGHQPHHRRRSGAGTGTAGSSYAEDDFPGIYDADDFNDCREDISDYSDRENVQNCRLVSLQDLKTSSEEVQDTLAAYMNDLIDLGVEGFRIDAAKHMPAEDLAAIKSKLSDPDIYWVQEVIGASGEPIQPSEYVAPATSTSSTTAAS